MSYVSISDSLSVNILLTILIPNFSTPQYFEGFLSFLLRILLFLQKIHKNSCFEERKNELKRFITQ
jgi:hypothetical protein